MRVSVGLVTLGVGLIGASACNALAGLTDLRFDDAAGGAGTAGAGGGAGGVGGGMAPDLVDDVFEDFDAGSFEGTIWQDDHVALTDESTSGSFVSRVFDAGETVTWTHIGWTPGGSYDKSLPDGGATETGYPDGGSDMSGNLLLWHFDGTEGPLSDNAIVDDGSGARHAGLVDGMSALTAGQFGEALADDTTSYVHTPIADGSTLDFGTSDFTWALWVSTTQDCPPDNAPTGNRVYLGAEESDTESTHLWFGCSSSDGGCPNADGTGRAAGTFCSRRSPSNDCQGYCGQSVINDGQWHHMVVVKEGHSPGALRVYVDGASDLAGGQIGIDFEVPIDFVAGTEFALGALSGGGFQAAGTFDEAAIWSRALSGDEIVRLYERGVLGLELQVRVCNEPDCSDEPPFVGPDGPDSAYVDPDGALSPPSAVPLQGLSPGRYLQYRAAMSTDAPSHSPKLYEVALTVE